jgi:hypothetical protein
MDSSSAKRTTARCLEGEQALGGGGSVLRANGGGTSGNVRMQALVPGTTSFFAQATEDFDGYSGAWGLSAYVVCVPDSLDLDPQIVSANSSVLRQVGPTEVVNEVAARCPAGKKVVGTGGIIGGPATFQQVRPNQQGAYAFVQAVRHHGEPGASSVTGMAVCANPIQGWRVAIDGTDMATTRQQVVSSDCGQDQLIGAGLTKGDSKGWAHVETMRPSGSPFEAVSVIGGIPDPIPTYEWNLAAWAICVS